MRREAGQLQLHLAKSQRQSSRQRHAHNYFVVAQQLFERGGFEEARRLLLLALQHDTEQTSVLRMLASVEHALGNTAEARDYLERALAVTEPDAELLMLQGKMALGDGDAATALESYLRAEQMGLESLELTFYLGLTNLMLGNGASAADAFSRIIDEYPAHERAWDGLGCARRLLKDFNGAISAFLRALQIDPSLNDARDHLAQVLLETGNIPRAKHFLTYAISLEPNRANSRHLLGLAHAAALEYRQAVECWETLIAQGGAQSETYHMLANAYLHLQEPRQAMKALEILVQLYPEHLSGHLQLALLLMEQGERSRGWAHLEQARALDPCNPTVTHALVVANSLTSGKHTFGDW